MNPRSELALYGDVRAWLLGYLRGIHPRAEIAAYDTHHVQLSAFLFQERLHESFPAYAAYEIKVDITGVIRSGSFTSLAFVECKIGPITLRDVGQLLGYSLVAQPELSFLISPCGLSGRLTTLLLTLGRSDILTYGKGLIIQTATWNWGRKGIDLPSLVPKGGHVPRSRRS